MCQNGGLPVLLSIGEREKNMLGVGRQSCRLWTEIPWVKRKRDGALSWCNSRFFCRENSEPSLRTFSRSRRKTLFGNNPVDVKENDEHALSFALLPSRLFRSL
jgi:hypothetical protein